MDAGKLMALMIVPMVSLPGTGQTLEVDGGWGGRKLKCLWAPELNFEFSWILSQIFSHTAQLCCFFFEVLCLWTASSLYQAAVGAVQSPQGLLWESVWSISLEAAKPSEAKSMGPGHP